MDIFYGKLIFRLSILCFIVAWVKTDSVDSYQDKYNHTVVETCNTTVPCIRFCCKNASKCLELDVFDLSMDPRAIKLSSFYTVVKGKPCKTMVAVNNSDSNWTFAEVNYSEHSQSDDKFMLTLSTFRMDRLWSIWFTKTETKVI